MIKIAVYGKGGIGKSTTVSNISASLADKGMRVMQIGCDPKADSTANLHGGTQIPTVLGLVRERQDGFSLDDMVTIGYKGIVCVEAGGPKPGLGCAGRGIIAALEKLREKGAYDIFKPDVVIYDVLGDVVCGGFTMPMRDGYADKVYIVTSGEKMAVYAAANIAMAVNNFKERGYASLGGFILNRRNVSNEDEIVNDLCRDFNSSVVSSIDRSHLVYEAEALGKTVVEAFPDSSISSQFRTLADKIISL